MTGKLFLIVLLAVTLTSVTAQEAEKEAVKQTVQGFFEAFHKQDSVGMKSFVADGVLLQTFHIAHALYIVCSRPLWK